MLGYDIALSSTNNSNQLNIGNLIFGTAINGQGTTVSTGNGGIGTTWPYAKLSVQGAGTGINFQATNSSQTPLFSILDNGNATLAGCLNYNGGTSGTCLG